jgi:hypothetical protein
MYLLSQPFFRNLHSASARDTESGALLIRALIGTFGCTRSAACLRRIARDDLMLAHDCPGHDSRGQAPSTAGDSS